MNTGQRAALGSRYHTVTSLLLLAAALALGTQLLGCGATAASGKAGDGSRYVMLDPLEPLSQCRDDQPARQWAVVVGINEYKDERIKDLNGAVNDAWSFYHFLSSPHGGAIPAVRMKLLINEEATRQAVTGALGGFLANACPKDQLIIYFAGHGSPEPERPDEAFLLVHDTMLDNMVGSAISMNQLPNFLKWRANNAGQLLMLIDACHSGSIQFPGRGAALADPNVRMTLTAEGITSAMDNQGDKNWGAISAAASDQTAAEVKGCQIGGYDYTGGLFTCHLLKGLSGSADRNGNGEVALGELYNYLDTNVRGDSNGQQSPQRSGNLDDGLVLTSIGADKVGIPTLPEAYSGAVAHPLRPWIYTGAGLTAAAAITGAVFSVQSQNKLEESQNSPDNASALQRESQDNTRLALASYGAAATLGAVTLGMLLYDLFKDPEGVEDVYQKPPLFELALHPTEDGADAWLQFNVAW